MGQDLVDALNTNLRTAGQIFADHAPGGAVRQFGPVMAASAGVPIPSFNRAFLTEPPPPEDLASAVAWLADRGHPFRVTAGYSGAAELEALESGDLALPKVDDSLGMGVPLEDIREAGGVATINEVTAEAALEDYISAFTDSFGMPPDIVERVSPPALLSHEAVRPFLGRVDGKPVASGLLLQSDDAAGVYNVGVIEPYRRRGIGEAMTRAVLRAGRDAGCRVGVLESSEMAVPLYEQMGFEPVGTFHHFEPASQVEDQDEE